MRLDDRLTGYATENVPLEPIVRVTLGAIAVALAVINPNRADA